MLLRKQLPRNFEEGGMIGFDIDNFEIDCLHEESHQIHLSRPLSNDEMRALDAIWNDYDLDGNCDDAGAWEDMWINCGEIPDEARAYLLALKA